MSSGKTTNYLIWKVILRKESSQIPAGYYSIA